MQFSTIKKRIMPFFADCLQGRIDLHSAVYRKAHAEAVVWMTLDGQQIFRYASYPFQHQQNARYKEAKLTLPPRPREVNLAIFESDWYRESTNLWNRIERRLQQEGQFDSYHVLTGLMDYPNLSIVAARTDENYFIRGLALLDWRFGKRQLVKVDEKQLSEFERLCYKLRMQMEEN